MKLKNDWTFAHTLFYLCMLFTASASISAFYMPYELIRELSKDEPLQVNTIGVTFKDLAIDLNNTEEIPEEVSIGGKFQTKAKIQVGYSFPFWLILCYRLNDIFAILFMTFAAFQAYFIIWNIAEKKPFEIKNPFRVKLVGWVLLGYCLIGDSFLYFSKFYFNELNTNAISFYKTSFSEYSWIIAILILVFGKLYQEAVQIHEEQMLTV